MDNFNTPFSRFKKSKKVLKKFYKDYESDCYLPPDLLLLCLEYLEQEKIVEYYPGKTKKKYECFSDIRYGEYKKFDTNYRLIKNGYYNNNKKHGKFIIFNNYGYRKFISYKFGIKHGICTTYYSNPISKQEEYFLVKGKKHGEYTYYFTGNIPKIKCNYVHGKIDGIFYQYYEDSSVHYKIEYKSGVKHGSYLYINKKKGCSQKFNYINGEKQEI